ncbi:hypothetical protein ASPCAL08566 [Aspergillus calidoustus]|uniref:Uncharacterized protein n=1 Tax=Aspergillus calidoustus TaxID=454130 RepID=A0A0U5GU59_ASPCI|nr:hypothetical protein ASPCAL08566 [Aspergillus calidoustus]
MDENMVTSKEYLPLLNGQESLTVELLSQGFDDDYRYEVMTNSIASTWLMCFRKVRSSNALAVEYLSFLACVSHHVFAAIYLIQGRLHDAKDIMLLVMETGRRALRPEHTDTIKSIPTLNGPRV